MRRKRESGRIEELKKGRIEEFPIILVELTYKI
jgi:hypothetical protein